MFGSLCLSVVLVGLVAATDLDTINEEGEERTIFTSGGTYYIALNTTYLLYYSAIAGIIVLTGVLLSSLFGEPEATGGYGQYQNKRADYDGQGGYKTKREAHEYSFTDQVVLLADAFKKYGLAKEVGCQLYVACESGNVSKHQKNGRLAKEIHQHLSGLSRSENEAFYKNDGYMKDMFSAFKLGSIGSSCAKFRKQCRNQKVF